MRFIGNIVTDSKMEDMVLYNIVKTIDDIDKTIPTLIIGWKKVNEYYPSVKILDWKINNLTYWTFGRREKGERYLSDLERFQDLCINVLYNTIEYEFFNVLIKENEEKKQFFKKLKDKTPKYVYIDNNIVYFYFDGVKVYGISLTDIEYEGGNIKKFLAILYNNESIKIIKTSDVDFQIRFLLNNRIYLIPYIFS